MEENSNSFISSVASSASGLFDSITRPPPFLTTSVLNAATSSSSKSGQQSLSQGQAGPSSWAESSSRSSSYRAVYSSNAPAEFRSQYVDPSVTLAAEDDYTCFASAQRPPPNAMPSDLEMCELDDGAAVRQLLNFPVASSVFQDDDPNIIATVNTSHPAVMEFASCEDPVEFLQSRWNDYTDSVWGDLLEVLKAAQKEVDKGKGTDDRATERLKQAWGQLRAKL